MIWPEDVESPLKNKQKQQTPDLLEKIFKLKLTGIVGHLHCVKIYGYDWFNKERNSQ